MTLQPPAHFATLNIVPEKKRAILICLLLGLITLAVYWPAIHFDFTNYDDPDYILLNEPIQYGVTHAAVVWAFTTNHASNWHPLTWLSHALDCQFFGLNPGGHHFTSFLFHAVNAVLLFLVLWQLTRSQWRSSLVAALFAWHPMHVESVAWVSERKDVLSAFFFILTLSAYGGYVCATRAASQNNSPANDRGRAKRFYLCSIALFALALLSKPMVVTLPAVLLLLDFWPFNRVAGRASWPKLIIEKMPFFILAALDSLATFLAQKTSNSVVSSAVLPFSARLANALVSYVLYLWKTIWPVNLAVPYPYSHEWGFLAAAAAALFLLLISAAVLLRARSQPYLAVGWFWFLGMLVPAIGLVQVGIQSMADRYTYLPLIGLFIALAWSIPAAWTEWPRPGLVFTVVVAGVLFFLLTGATVQLQYWRNSIALFSHTVAVTPNNILAEYNLAEALARAGRNDEAITHYQAALALQPNRVEAQYNSQIQARYNLGLIYRIEKKWPEAEVQFRAFIHEAPTEPAGYVQLGIALVALGRADEATDQFRLGLHLHPLGPGQNETIEVLAKLEEAYFLTGQTNAAIIAAQKIHDDALLEGRMDIAGAAQKRITDYRAQKP